ncbi:copper chaperone PCu(A)C [Parvibaculum sp.]|uniref:copper chaperone PCu(A)C n=1 Tax=Parvibaculum sp. TaxID=2024848 RepID=UPI001D253477|nr:copper chaperone PCu(A)C [Parvibaculum sp.]MBX3489646.1 copper chaperone PCu(A)C [Parvibaculum sp.]MCW5726396.1 copper chaperone PCu(A)C [Parvibaculum sp.]
MMSPLLRAAFLLLALAGFAAPAAAGESIVVSDPWARASVTATGAAYLTLENAGGEDDALVEARSDVAEKVEIHDMTMDGMVMRMRKLDRLALPAGETVRLAPGGLHIMLIRLHGPLAEGNAVPLTLVFEKAGEIDISATVRKAGHGGGHGGH